MNCAHSTLRIGGFLLALGCALFFGCQRSPSAYTIASTATNISGVSFAITRGTNHVFYYPSRVRWDIDRCWKALGFRGSPNVERRTMRTFQSADVLWVACKYRGPSVPYARYEASIISTNKVTRRITSSGALRDTQRGVALTAWPVLRDSHWRGPSTLRVKETTCRADLVTFQLR
jgi:hypothetical protein